MEVNNAQDVALADALVELDAALAMDDMKHGIGSYRKMVLAKVLDLTTPGWKDNPTAVEWVKAQGVVAASRAILKRHLT